MTTIVRRVLAASERLRRNASFLLAVVWVSALAPGLVAAQFEARSLDGVWRMKALSGKRGDAPLAAEDPARRARDAWVPAAWEHELGEDFDGVVEYTRAIRASRPEPGVSHALRFAAVMTHAKVYFNEHELGEHLGGWTPFEFRLAPELFVDGGEQRLRVVVDERVGHATQGFLPDIAPHFGGIWQSVTWKTTRGAGLDPDTVELRTRVDSERGTIQVRWESAPALQGGGLVATLLLDGEEITTARNGRQRGDYTVLEGPPSVGALPLDTKVEATRRTGCLDVQVERPRLWRPESPERYTLRVELVRRGEDGKPLRLDAIERTIAFVDLAVQGREVRVSGKARALRGILHWGYAPPSYAPSPPEAYWREEMRFAKSAGFDMIKACLWLPPPRFFEIALEEGLFVWSEYPAWHPDFSAKNREALLREYAEFFRADRVWPHVVARSLTCETGRGSADAGVIEALFEQCKRETGGLLVEDDSSWITWNRFHDFYDDHPYGNPRDWLKRLYGFDEYMAKRAPEKGEMPFLIGEAFAGDTWVDIPALDAWRRTDAARAAMWWRPLALPEMRAFEERVAARYGEAARRALVPDSEHQAMRLRKYELEAFRCVLPRAGYTVSVMRDFRRARMGFFDDLGAPKWGAEDFSWHGARMLVLRDARAIRSLTHDRLAGFVPELRLAGDPGKSGAVSLSVRVDVEDARGDLLRRSQLDGRRRALVQEKPLLWRVSGPRDTGGLMPELPDAPLRVRARMELRGLAKNSWDFWSFPAPASGGGAQLPAGVRVSEGLDAATLDWVAEGGRLLLLPGRGAPSSRGLWFLEGAAYGPTEHPLLERLPRAMLQELQAFDLHGPVFHETELSQAFHKLLGYWDTHDERERVQDYTMLAEARVGRGRVVLCALDTSLRAELGLDVGKTHESRPNPARAWLRRVLVRHLAEGPAPVAELAPALVRRWRAALRAERVALDGVWRLCKDPERVGVRERWFEADEKSAAAWIASRAGAHWEAAGLPHYTGQAWYQKSFTPPASWKPGDQLWLVCDGVDDSYEVFVNGESCGTHGDEATGETVWLVRTSTEISRAARKGVNSLVLRVVDHQGAGGLHRPVSISTAKPEERPLLQER